MRLKLSNFFNPIFFLIKYAQVFEMHFLGHVLHNFTFHDLLRPFLTSMVCHLTLRNHVNYVPNVQPMSLKFTLGDS